MSIPNNASQTATASTNPLDPALLSRLANELFAALPGAEAVTSPTSAVPASLDSGQASRGSAPNDFTPPDLPSEALAVPRVPVIPDPGVGHSFYFLDPGAAGAPRSAPALNLSPEHLGAVPFSGPAYAIPSVATHSPRGVPELPAGDPLTAAGEAATLPLYFLDESRAFATLPEQPEVTADPRIEALPDPQLASSHPALDPYLIRRDFPILRETVNGHPLIWLDNGATTQKPQAVIDRLDYFYRHENSNIHRAAHELAARATDAYEAARDKVARFIHAASPDEVVFVRGTTEGINLVAQSWGRQNIGPGDEIVITWLEHHANIVPWQQLCAATGAVLRVAPVDDRGQILLDEYQKLFGPRTRLAAFSQVSNALGTITPAREMIEIAHRSGARVLVDGAQSVAHMRTDVQALDCDWFVFSSHKVFAPTGIGAVYGKLDLLNTTPPWQGGGNMIQDVTFERTIYQAAPARFEAGTGNIADAVGLGAALDYVERIGIDNINRAEHDLLAYATLGLKAVPSLTIIGNAQEKAGVLSFVLDGFRSEEVGEALNREGIAVRAGHHCAQPILRRFGLETTVRATLALYNTCEDIDALVLALLRIQGGSTELRR